LESGYPASGYGEPGSRFCLLVWIEYHWAETKLVYMEDATSSKTQISHQPFVHDGNELKVGMDMYFVYKDTLYSAPIEMFRLDSLDDYSGKMINVYGVCGIPEHFVHSERQLPTTPEIVFSTSRDMRLFYSELDTSAGDSSIQVFDHYKITSFHRATGELNDAFQPTYRSFFRVECEDSVIIYKGIGEYPYRYVVGDFNGNGKTDLFLTYEDWDDYFYDIYEFDGCHFKTKMYETLIYD
jgi:hypothetical protein